jgi:hypothetical protein
MPPLLLRFAIVLENFSVEPCDPVSGERRHGPLFCKWLPDGEKDAIELSVSEPDAELRVWFERSGFVENGRIKFDYERKELDPAIVEALPVLDAGPLIGVLRLSSIPGEVLETMQRNQTGDPAYVAFGRKVIQLIRDPVSRLLGILRTNYGQYWLNELRDWNAARESLGSYFSLTVQTTWSLDDGATWSDFIPDSPETRPESEPSAENYEALLTREDWRGLQKILSEGYEPRLGAELLTRAHQLIERNDLRSAVIHAGTALEVAVQEFMSRKMRLNKPLAEQLQSFAALPLPARVAAVATLSGALSHQQVEPVLKLADMHQKIVREGWDPPATARGELAGALQAIAALLSGPSFKFPSYYTVAPVFEVQGAESQETQA